MTRAADTASAFVQALHAIQHAERCKGPICVVSFRKRRHKTFTSSHAKHFNPMTMNPTLLRLLQERLGGGDDDGNDDMPDPKSSGDSSGG